MSKRTSTIAALAADALTRAPKRPAIGYFRKYWEVVERMHPELVNPSNRQQFLQIVEGAVR